MTLIFEHLEHQQHQEDPKFGHGESPKEHSFIDSLINE